MKILAIVFLVVSFFGFLDATYLTTEYYLGAIPSCVITVGCGTVLASEWHAIWGIPVALLGAIYYLLFFLLTVAYLSSGRESLIILAASVASMGFLASLWFVYLQLFVIGEICFYCMISAVTSTTLFITGLFVLYTYKKSKNIV